MYGWLGVYYRRASAKPGFAQMNPAQQWNMLRDEVLASNPLNDASRREAIGSIEESRRAAILERFAGAK
jgi:hypothetical protein